jgi:hypothetical protein
MRLGILSLLLISFLVVGLSMGVFSTFIKESYSSYSGNIQGNYSGTALDGMNRAAEVKIAVDRAQNESGFTKDNPTQSFSDVVGSLFNSGKNAVKAGFGSVTTFNSLVDSAQSNVNDVSLFPFFDTAKTVMLIILIFGLVIAILVKWNV